MKIQNSIQNEADYWQALDTVYALMQGQVQEGSAAEDQLLYLTDLIETYEAVNHSIGEQTDPVEAIKFRMEQMGLKNKDVAPIFGGVTRASEYLNKKRPLTMKIIYNLHKYLDIPYDLLIEGRENFELEDTAKETLEGNLNRTIKSTG